MSPGRRHSWQIVHHLFGSLELKKKKKTASESPEGDSTAELTRSFVILTAIDTDVWINDMFPPNIMPSIKQIWDTESTCHFETRVQTRFIQQTSVTYKNPGCYFSFCVLLEQQLVTGFVETLGFLWAVLTHSVYCGGVYTKLAFCGRTLIRSYMRHVCFFKKNCLFMCMPWYKKLIYTRCSEKTTVLFRPVGEMDNRIKTSSFFFVVSMTTSECSRHV